jgi:hypothetical protein
MIKAKKHLVLEMHVWRLLLLLLIVGQECYCDIMSIGDNMYPYVTLLDPAVPVIWHHKFFAQRMAVAQVSVVDSVQT